MPVNPSVFKVVQSWGLRVKSFHPEAEHMNMPTTNCSMMVKSCNDYLPSASIFFGRDKKDICGHRGSPKFPTKLCYVNFEFRGCRGNIKTLAAKKLGKKGKTKKDRKGVAPPEQLSDEYDGLVEPLSIDHIENGNEVVCSDTLEDHPPVAVPSRSAVLQACVVTSGFIGVLGLLIRQVSHIAFGQGWPVIDCSAAITFNFELWHLELIVGSVVLVSSCRFLLLKIWPDFAESSNSANQQVLSSLEPLDYFTIAFLPGISEELLFRGALLPLSEIKWTSILAVAVLFGVLHLGSGRKYSFAIWATFVGLVYGYATALSSNITVAMASHALNNLVGATAWRYSSDSMKQLR